MTISSSTTRNVYSGNGATTTFAYNFKIYANTQLLVYVDDVLKTLTTHYTVTGVGTSGGNVVFGTAPPATAASNVVILRNVPLTQETDYVENDPFPAATHEDALDKLTMISQQLNEKIGRSALLAPSSTLSSLVLPTPAAGTAIVWNSTADGLENSGVVATIVSDATAQAVAAAASASAASTSASNASTSASNASTSASNASTSASNASTSASTASTQATNASNSATAAAATVEASATIKYLFDSSTTMADPGTGDIRLNNATIASVTSIAVSASAASTGNPDMSDWIVTWDDSTNTNKGTLVLREAGASTFAAFTVTGVTDNTAWLELAVTHVASTGTLSAADVLFVGFSRAGDVGATGSVSDGDKGDITVTSSGATWTIDNDAVTYAKMQNVSATSRILGRKTAAAGDTEECTLSEVLDFVGSAAQGDILYRGASAWARLGAGTSGYFLKTQGAAANPAWAAVTAGWTQAATQATTSGTSIDFTGIPSTATVIHVTLSGVSTNGTSPLLVQLGDAGGVETSGYESGAAGMGGSGNVSTQGLLIDDAPGAGMAYSALVILSLQDAATFKWVMTGSGVSAATSRKIVFTGMKATSQQMDRIRLATANGTDTFDAGSVSIKYM